MWFLGTVASVALMVMGKLLLMGLEMVAKSSNIYKTRLHGKHALTGYCLLKKNFMFAIFKLFSFKTKLFMPNNTFAPFNPEVNKWGLLSALSKLSCGYLAYIAQPLGVLVPRETSWRKTGGLVRLEKPVLFVQQVFNPDMHLAAEVLHCPCAQCPPALLQPDTSARTAVLL